MLVRTTFVSAVAALALGCSFEGGQAQSDVDASAVADANTDVADAEVADAALPSQCETEFVDHAHEGSRYRLVLDALSFSSAQTLCDATGIGQLSRIENAAELADLVVYLSLQNVRSAWFGLSQSSSDDEPNGNWVWEDGDPHTPTAFGWANNEPNDNGVGNGSEDCAELVSMGNDIGWNDDRCEKPQPSLCECQVP